MDLDYLKKIVRLAKRAGVAELEIEENGVRVKLRNDYAPQVSRATLYAAPELVPGQGYMHAPPPGMTPQAAATPAAVDSDTKTVDSPMVGTFYRAPAPDAPPFVNVGAIVEPNTVVCIIEAMKVMNEIKAGFAGKIAEVLVENGQPVEYGQPLFAIKPN